MSLDYELLSGGAPGHRDSLRVGVMTRGHEQRASVLGVHSDILIAVLGVAALGHCAGLSQKACVDRTCYGSVCGKEE